MTPLFIHNTLSGKKEKFKPAASTKAAKANTSVSMYNCGPTVYDSAHIGNLRTFVMDDIVRRVFEYKGYMVEQAMNITDVDDKTIRRSAEQGVSVEALTEKYEKLFWQDMASLNILTPQHILSARGNIDSMIELINVLLKKGVAYIAEDGVYVSVAKVKQYGELAHLKLEKTDKKEKSEQNYERIANDEYDKENPRDFAVWKFPSAEETERPSAVSAIWDAPFGKGRPGWHIECSAMSMKVFGPTIDIHTGGTDLIFPHHTNEIAQSESATGKPFVRYWIHGGFMNVDDVKMAKSKGNFLKLSDLISEHISPIAFRYWLLTSHYRSQVNFSFDAVRAAQTALFKLCHDVIGWAEAETEVNKNKDENKNNEEKVKNIKKESTNTKKYKEDFDIFISDDFNMPKAIALLWKVVKDPAFSPAEKRLLALDFDKVFGLRLAELSPVADPINPNDTLENSDSSRTKNNKNAQEIPPEITALAEARLAARLSRDFQKADALRLEIESRGYHVKDTEEGFKIEG
jgi:cysteinyl-tRNA synthetase